MSTGSFLSPSDAAWMFTPALLGWLVKKGFALSEQRFRRRVGAESVRATAVVWKRPVLREDLVDQWMREASRSPSPRKGRVRAWLTGQIAEIAFLPLLAVVGGIMIIWVAALMSIADGAAAQADYARWTRELRAVAGFSWSSLDTVVRTSAGVDRRVDLPDIVAARALLAVGRSERSPAEWLALESPSPPHMSVVETLARPSDVMAAWSLLPGRLPDSVRTALVESSQSDVLQVWRRVARSSPLPPLWYAQPGLPGAVDPAALPGSALTIFGALARANAAAAVLAAEQGSFQEAEERVREILAVGYGFWRDAIPGTHRVGIGILRLGQESLEELAIVSGDRMLAREAQRLERVLQTRAAAVEFFTARMTSLAMKDVENPVGLAWIADRSLAPADRWSLLAGLVLAPCWNGREIHVGVSPGRYRTLESAADSLGDIARSTEWGEVVRRGLDALSAAEPPAGLVGVWRPIVGPLGRAVRCGAVRRGR